MAVFIDVIGEKDIFASLAEHFSFGILLLFDYICSQKEKGITDH